MVAFDRKQKGILQFKAGITLEMATGYCVAACGCERWNQTGRSSSWSIVRWRRSICV